MCTRNLFRLVALLFFMAAPAVASFQTSEPSSADRQRLEELNARWLNAYVSRDAAALGSVLADDFIGVYGPRILSKSQMLAALENRRITSVRWEDLRLSVNGDTAVVTAISTVTTAQGESSATSRYRYADVYARRDGNWKAIASHVVRLET